MEKTKFVEMVNAYALEKVDGRVRWAKNSRIKKALLEAANKDGKVYYYERKVIRAMCFETDISSEIKMFLIKKCIPFSLGNDAPRGGRTGDYIQIKLK